MFTSGLQRRGFSAWLHKRLAEAPKHKTKAVLVDKSEVATLDCLKPYSESTHFRQDLTLMKHHWIYNPQHGRMLVVQQDSTDKNMPKHIRDLGTLACAQLQAKKSADVEVICSGKIDPEHLGIFHNSFHLTNYEWSIKDDTKPEKKEEDEKDGEPKDERLDRKSKLVDSVEVTHEQGTARDSYHKQMVMAEATHFARNLANVRGSDATPCYMEEQVTKLCDQHKDLIKEVRVVRGQQLLDEKMNLFHAVGRAALSEPRMVVVHYEGDPASKETTALVGKGVTYDTGGLNLKPTGYMEDMYGDKNGSCAVIGALHGVMATKPKLNIVFAMAFAENAIDSKSYKPGDIISSRKGLTVEIGNTDAEGRLVLCDTLTYVQDHFKPDTIIDLATLTGHIMIALGKETAGLFSNDDELS